MSGHSKWAKIKRQKGANDANKGAVFTKLAREIQVAAREGAHNPGGRDPDEVALNAIEAGAEDVTADDASVEIYTPFEGLEPVRTALEAAGLSIEHAEASLLPKTTVELGDEQATQVLKLIDRL